jgi:hypothetical protein
MDISKIFDNEYVNATIGLFLIVYASMGTIELPNWLVSLFKNDIFRVFYLSLLLMIPFEKAPSVSILVAIVFVVVMNYISNKTLKEGFINMEKFKANLKNKKQKITLNSI